MKAKFVFIFFLLAEILFAAGTPIRYSMSAPDTLEAVFELPCNIDKLWSVITDYGNSDKIMPNIKKATVLSSSRNGKIDTAYVETTAGSGPFTTKYTVKMTADKSKGLISWEQTKGSFTKNCGSWHLTAVAEKRTEVTYTVSLSHRLMPDSLKNSLAKRSLPDLYESLKKHTQD